jgi:hypothetical protein
VLDCVLDDCSRLVWRRLEWDVDPICSEHDAIDGHDGGSDIDGRSSESRVK